MPETAVKVRKDRYWKSLIFYFVLYSFFHHDVRWDDEIGLEIRDVSGSLSAQQSGL